MYQYIYLIFFLLIASCNSNDDICTENGTPLMNLDFKNNNGDIKTLDTLYLEVEMANHKKIEIAKAQTNVKEIKVPLRVDPSTTTNIYLRTRKLGPVSLFRINYQQKTQYASPACGYRVLYQNISANLLQSNPVQSILPAQNDITNEDNPHFHLIF